ncbi:MAG: HIT domain-containing protein [Candidatus Zixiibacteriota bacterium]|jgi:ATP adenylyltransferase
MEEKFIWAPWRSEYILGKKEKGCIFCNRIRRRQDSRDLIVYRGKRIFVIMNKFPYNSGHVMVVPKRHIKSLESMTAEESTEFLELVKLTTRVLRLTLNPQSFNLGMNLGRGSGAGVPGHIHMHIVPRWNEDTSFMPVISKTRVVSFDLGMIYDMLRKGFDSVCPEQKSRPKRN